MPQEILAPQLDLLSEEYVLVQAWKKTSAYIRGHNWYADTLDLDRTTVDLRRFLRKLAERLKNPTEWRNQPLRIVPAPKAQNWRVDSVDGTRRWVPVDGNIAGKLRPLAHVAFAEQVAATAVMLCLADRVESAQGDPRQSVATSEVRKQTVSYGNRLFCDSDGTLLRHRWGSSKLYRAYFTDYEAFLSRPESVAREVTTPGRVIVVHSDLRQFYDRVTTALMSQKLRSAARPLDDSGFYPFVEQLLRWEWHPADVREADALARASGRDAFGSVVLPQGLVASGFFANFVLLDFDKAMSASIGDEIFSGFVLEDYCRYVDDIRMVLTVRDDSPDLATIETVVADVLQQRLNIDATGLIVSPEKTIATTVREDVRPIVRQSRRMRSLQQAVSGGFDAVGGEEILASIQGLLGTQNRHSRREDSGWSFAPVPDVRDATVARFAAGRYRTTFRSLRPLLESTESGTVVPEDSEDTAAAIRSSVPPRTQADLDDDARVFALGLIDRWIEDPSNVRLLRIGLDLWPAEDLLRDVLDLLRPFTEKGGKRKGPRRVAWYCLAEIFRAGATETAFVEDEESLPASLNPEAYRTALRQEAHRLLALSPRTMPWYLLQQVLLFVAVAERDPAFSRRSGTRAETRHYRDLIRFLGGRDDHVSVSEYAIMAILTRRSYRDAETAIRLADRTLNQPRLTAIALRDPTFARELALFNRDRPVNLTWRRADHVNSAELVEDAGRVPLAAIVSGHSATLQLRDELSLLSFAAIAIPKLVAADVRTVEPDEVIAVLGSESPGSSSIRDVEIRVRADEESTFTPPDWCPREQRWRFQIGYLLRYILTYGAADVMRRVRGASWREMSPVYRAPESHWYQRVHGSFNAVSGFGDDWVPISSWTEELLSALLAWPGMKRTSMTIVVDGGPLKVVDALNDQIGAITARRGPATGLLVIPLRSAWLVPGKEPRPLRGCVVQTVVPDLADFEGDLTLSSRAVRKKHRNHLSASLAAIEKMLTLRATHHLHRDRLDWLILPELAVHPADIRTHLLPFARAHKTIILAGLAYQRLLPDQPLVNSALWVVPQRTPSGGVDVVLRRQGKCHLAAIEHDFNAAGTAVRSFRPCQWVVEYEWCTDPKMPPLCLTASICYDATDLKLASDMRDRSDVFAIPAFNRDVLTFDQMALALHYHMFQMVVVANNGLYGGSNAYLPYRDSFRKQVFHMHGQPQASIAFFEIDDIGAFLKRKSAAKVPSDAALQNLWKYPPAGS